jgi:anti-sigma regulatory factor (Ser/Thr protein kinase)
VSRSSPEILRLRLRCDVFAPRRARRALEGLEAIEPVHDDALLVASELATNAVRRSARGADSEIELLAELVPDGLRIAVTDTCRLAPTPAPGPEAGQIGLGLRIVQGIARRWGAERRDGGQMWAVLAI